MVPVLSIVFMAISCLLSFAAPMGLLVYFRRKYQASVSSFFTGFGVMFVFAFILEPLVHSVVLRTFPITSIPWLYALYGGLMAGIFEETGRFVAYKTLLKDRMENNANALMYGAGHGGFECIWLLGIAMMNNLVWSVMINTGNITQITGSLSEDLLIQAQATVNTLTGSPSYMFLLGIVERFMALALQLSLSVIVWKAVKENKKQFFFLAVIIHAAVDSVAVLLAYSLPVLLVELAVLLMTAAVVFYALRVWKTLKGNEYET
ncbi:MAG: YhfC family intramembrane metalloprotease [Sphaerochaetaceae bacterium]|nr:YhfC family intramembrane metalloprotease [Sphaerochaetaceae bacterium]